MGTWSTTAPTNLKTDWTAMAMNANTNGQYRVRANNSYVYISFVCRVRACSAWLTDGRLCVKIENYSFSSTSPGESLVTQASITNENGSTVYAANNTSKLGDSSETSYGHLRGTYYYTYDASYTSPGTITAGIKPISPKNASSLYPAYASQDYWVDATATVTVNKAARPSYGNAVYVKVGGVWKKASAAYIKTGGVWKKAADVNIKTGGTWK